MESISFVGIGAVSWDTFCEASPDAWVWHTSAGLRLGASFTEGAENLSFGLQKDGTLIAVVPLILERGASGEAECAMGGTAIPFPACSPALDEEEKKEVLDSIFAEIDRIARERGVSRTIFSVDPLAPSSALLSENPLPLFGFSDTSITTAIVDLQKSEDELLSAVQSRQRRYIRAALKLGYTADFFDEHTATDKGCTDFEKLYTHAAGRIVGTPERWGATWEMVRAGLGIVLLFRAPGEAEY